MILDIARPDQLGVVAMHEGGGLAFQNALDGALGNRIAIAAFLGRHVEQIDRDSRIGDLGGNPVAHQASADDGGAANFHQTASIIVVMPWPPPMHWVESANFLPSRFNNWAALPVMRAPVAPKGWPRAVAPPSRFVLAQSIFRASMQASA